MPLLRSRPTGVFSSGILKCLQLKHGPHARFDVGALERHTYQNALQA